MSCVRCQLSGARYQVSGVRCLFLTLKKKVKNYNTKNASDEEPNEEINTGVK